MVERRTFFDWVKCPIEFGKKFEYVIFRTRPDVYRYVGFSRRYTDNGVDKIILDFRRIFIDERNIISEAYIEQFYPGWYNEAKCLTEKEAIDYLMNKKSQQDITSQKEKKGILSWFKRHN